MKLNSLQHSWWLFWSFTAVFTALTLWPFLTNDYPGLADYANHLTRLHLLTGKVHEGWQQYYSVHHEIVANLALDVIGSVFAQFGLSPEVALRLFAAITTLLVVGGVYAVAWAVNRQPPWLAVWAFILIFNRYFIWGFLNYFFSVGLGLLIFALWIIARDFSKKCHQNSVKLAISLLLIGALLSHLMGYAIALLCIFLYEFGRVLAVERHLAKIFRHLSLVFLVFVPSILFYFFVCVHGSGLNVQYYDVLQSKISGLVSPFISYDSTLASFYFLSFMAALLIALTSRFKAHSNVKNFIAEVYPRFSFFIPAALFLLYIILPSAMMGSAFLDKRIFVVVLLLTIALLVIKLDSKSVMIIMAISLVTHFIKMTEVNNVWIAHSNAMHEIVQALDKIKVGAKINSFNFGDSERMPVPPLQHAVSLAISQRAAYVPTLFAKPINMESVEFNPPFDQQAYSTSTFKFDRSLSVMANTKYITHTENACAFYDYTLITFVTYQPKVPSCFQPIASGKHFVLYEIKKMP